MVESANCVTGLSTRMTPVPIDSIPILWRCSIFQWVNAIEQSVGVTFKNDSLTLSALHFQKTQSEIFTPLFFTMTQCDLLFTFQKTTPTNKQCAPIDPTQSHYEILPYRMCCSYSQVLKLFKKKGCLLFLLHFYVEMCMYTVTTVYSVVYCIS